MTRHKREISGRDFGSLEERGGGWPRTAVINQSMARRYFGEGNPLGRSFYFRNHPEEKYEIVGVVGDAIYRSLRETPKPTFYAPLYQSSDDGQATFALRTTGEPGALTADLRSVVRSLDPRPERLACVFRLENVDMPLALQQYVIPERHPLRV